MKSVQPERSRGPHLPVLFIIIALTACGYRVRVPDAALPTGIDRVHVPVFTNSTSEPAAEALFTEATREALLRAGRLGSDTVPDSLEGVVTGISSGPLVASPGRLANYRMNASVRLTLKVAGKVVKTVDGSAVEDFPPGADVLWAESNRAAALRRIASLAVRDALDKLGSGL